jgi:hypothetical protein
MWKINKISIIKKKMFNVLCIEYCVFSNILDKINKLSIIIQSFANQSGK